MELLIKNYTVMIDDDDYDRLKDMSWRISNQGNHIYALNSKDEKMHRVILGLGKGRTKVVDHINHNGLDNRKDNLRICSMSENLMNSRKLKQGTSPYKGVTKYGAKYRARIYVDNKLTSLGMYENEKEAAKAYDMAAIKFFGQFAKLNFNSDAD